MQFRKFLYLLAFLAILTMAVRVSTASDTFWHLRAGEWILDNGKILREDPFSLTRFGEAWRYPGWMSQVLLISAFRFLGFPGLNLLTTLFVLLAFLFVFLAMQGRDSIRISVLLLAAVASAVYWSARPHIITFALTGYFLWVLETYKRGETNFLWTLPLGMALWGNIHGGFASGFILIACYLVGEIVEAAVSIIDGRTEVSEALAGFGNSIVHYAVFGLISAATLSLNPHGPRMLLYPFITVGIESLQDYIQEWQSPNFHDPQVFPFVILILLLILAFGISKKKKSAHEYILTAVFLFLALTAMRNIALFALVSSVVLSRHLSSGFGPILDRIKSKDEFRPELVKRLNVILFALCVIAAAIKISIPLRPSVNRLELENLYPYEAIEFLETHKPPGPMFNSYNWGAFILWELYPDYRTFVDGRTDLFNDEVLKAYLAAWRGRPEWREVFTRWDIQLVFIEVDAPLRYQLDIEGWETLYEDDQSIIMVP